MIVRPLVEEDAVTKYPPLMRPGKESVIPRKCICKYMKTTEAVKHIAST